MAAVSLVGCGGAAQAIGGSQAIPNVARAHASTSSGKDLLYVIDSFKNAVDIYTYPGETYIVTLTGFRVPAGLCVDGAGDVFVTDAKAYDIVEYAHGGTTPIATLADPDSSPGGCAVDPKTGDLAVANEENWDYHYNWGNLAIYKHARGKPKLLTDYPNIDFYQSCAYDDAGNLYIVGTTPYVDNLAEIRAGKSHFINLALNAFFFSWGGVQWDGQYLALQRYDRDHNVIYRLAISGKNATIVDKVDTRGAKFINGFFIDGDTVIVPNGERRDNRIGTWSYPHGGQPRTQVKVDGTWLGSPVVSQG
ncbi:MAG TPA: hypothetical protein VGX91_04050 [Candidatus Cybelea sp.]|nr:hypothetical protein [Candidatus Cybelea sp.]